TALYFTPAGCSIQGQGIVPNVEVQPANAQLRALDGDLLKESELHGVLKAPSECAKLTPQYTLTLPAEAKAPTALTQSEKQEAEAALSESITQRPDLAKDYQLREAMAILQGKQVPVQVGKETVEERIPLPKAVGQ
ncbi:MAG: S41 family peptidase, partial [Acidithiobacillus sp.]